MYNVRQILQVKGNQVWSVSPESKMREAIQLLAQKRVGALLVVEGERIVGIVSERDFVRVMAERDECSLNSPVREFMTEVLYTVSPNDTMDSCMALMTQRKIRHLPVFEGDRLVGIISIGDVVKEVIGNREDEIHNLENYILGEGYIR